MKHFQLYFLFVAHLYPLMLEGCLHFWLKLEYRGELGFFHPQ